MDEALPKLLILDAASSNSEDDGRLALRLAERIWNSGRFSLELIPAIRTDRDDNLPVSCLRRADAILIPVDPDSEGFEMLHGWIRQAGPTLKEKAVGLATEPKDKKARKHSRLLETILNAAHIDARQWHLDLSQPGSGLEALHAWVTNRYPARPLDASGLR